MQFCPTCKVRVAGCKCRCPLCAGALSGTPDAESEVFPLLPRPHVSTHFVQLALALVAIIVSAICVLINLVTPSQVWWSLLVVAGMACAWVTTVIAIAHRRDLTQNIAWQLAFVTLISFIWDGCTGWHGWAASYVLPCGCAAALIAMLLLILLLRLPLRSFATSLLFCTLLGLLPAVLVACGKVRVVLPSLICSGLAIVVLAALLLFFGNTVKSEFHRRLHL